MASLNIASAHVGRLGNVADNERAYQQAEEILAHFARHTRQGKRYGHILSRLYKAAKDYVTAIERKERRSRNIAMPALFSLGDKNQQTNGINEMRSQETCLPGSPFGQEPRPMPMAEFQPSSNSEASPSDDPVHHLEPLLWGPSGPDGQWLTMDYATITDIIDSFGGEINTARAEDAIQDGLPTWNTENGGYALDSVTWDDLPGVEPGTAMSGWRGSA